MSESETIACPYCNSQFPRPAQADAGRWQCPRCGDSFPADPSVLADSAAGLPSAAALAPPQAPATRRTAGLLLGLMLCMALLALFYALYTQPWRRSLDQKLPGAGAAGLAPAHDLPGPLTDHPSWNYLPQTTSLAAALQLAALRRVPSGKALWERLQPSLQPLWQPVEAKTGVKLDDLDHLLLALYPLPEGAPRLLLVAHSQQPLTPLLQLQALPRPQDYRGRPVYHWTLDPWGELWLWHVADNTLLCNLGLLPASLQVWEEVPAPQSKNQPVSSGPPLLRPALRRLPHPSLAVILAADKAWEAVRDLGGLPQGQKDFWDRLSSLSSIGLSVTAAETELTLLAALQTADPADVQRWRPFWEQQQARFPKLTWRLTGPDPDDQGGFWTQVQVRGSAEDLAELLRACLPLMPPRR
jgi:hypothetical protein